MSLKSMLDSRISGPNGALLKGSDVPESAQSVTVEIAAIRQSPDSFSAPALMDCKNQVHGKDGLALNKTNLKTLIEMFGPDEKASVGKRVRLDIVMTENPQSHQTVRSLRIRPKK